MNQNYKTIVFAELPPFVQAFVNETIEREGGYVNHSNDHETMYGIRRLSADNAGYEGEIRDITRDTAARIWAANYWYAPRFDMIAEVSPLTAKTVMDTAGPAGTHVAIKHLQQALTSCNAIAFERPIYGADLVIDGVMGRKTQDQLSAYLIHRKNQKGERNLASMLNCLQAAHFVDVAIRLPSKRTFSFGWNSQRVVADLDELAFYAAKITA